METDNNVVARTIVGLEAEGTKATAAAIPGAELVLVDGMGHDIPPALWDRIAAHIAATVRRAEAR